MSNHPQKSNIWATVLLLGFVCGIHERYSRKRLIPSLRSTIMKPIQLIRPIKSYAQFPASLSNMILQVFYLWLFTSRIDLPWGALNWRTQDREAYTLHKHPSLEADLTQQPHAGYPLSDLQHESNRIAAATIYNRLTTHSQVLATPKL